MNVNVHRWCVYSGYGFVLLFLVGFWIVAGFVPPPSPNADAATIAALFRENTTSIRVGMLLSVGAAALLAPWVAAMTVFMKRIEGRHTPLAYIQLGLGMIGVLEFIYLLMFWQVATFRTERSDEAIQTLNDMAWIPFVGLTSTVVLQSLVIGVAIVVDRGSKPVFPRWSGYFNIWCALMFTPGSFNVFFKSGPLAWNGLVAWYLPLTTFCIWMLVMCWLMLKALSDGALGTPAGDTDADADGDVRQATDRIAAELAEVQAKLAGSGIGASGARSS